MTWTLLISDPAGLSQLEVTSSRPMALDMVVLKVEHDRNCQVLGLIQPDGSIKELEP